MNTRKRFIDSPVSRFRGEPLYRAGVDYGKQQQALLQLQTHGPRCIAADLPRGLIIDTAYGYVYCPKPVV